MVVSRAAVPSLLLESSLRSLQGGAGNAAVEGATSMTVQQWEKLLDADRGALIRSWDRPTTTGTAAPTASCSADRSS